MKRLILFAFSLIYLAGCAASQKKVAEQPKDTQDTFPYDESFDPLSLNDDDIVIEKTEESSQIENGLRNKPPIEEEEPVAGREVDGYRVQLLATRSIEAATMVRQKAQEQFASFNHTVYWSFEAPFYKIRIGDVLKRTDALSIRDLAKGMGYDQAFPVRSKVIATQNQN